MLILPPSKIFIAWMKPCPTSPSTWLWGTRHWSNTNSAVSLHRMPNLFSFLPPEKPGVPRSTTKAVIPLLSKGSPVLARTTATSPEMPWVIQFLVPWSTHSSPSSLATHCIRMASLPVLASVNPQAPIHSPEASLGNHFDFCSCVPKAKMWPVHKLLCAAIDSPTEPHTLASSSMAILYS